MAKFRIHLGKKDVLLPAKVTPTEKQDVLSRLNNRIATVNHKYAFQMKHGGTTEKKQRTQKELRMLENERKALARMQPLAGHVKRAEKG